AVGWGRGGGHRAAGDRGAHRAHGARDADRVRVPAEPLHHADPGAAGRTPGAPLHHRAQPRAWRRDRADRCAQVAHADRRRAGLLIMPGAGTDKTRSWIETPGPIIVLVEPQLGENIGAAARVMANFGLGRLRLVKPRDGWPNIQAQRSASGADRILDDVALFDSVKAAIADCTLVLATTARAHDQAKPVLGPAQAAAFLAPHVTAGENVAVLFGRERYGLENDEVALADRIVTFPVNPAFASLNLAQAVALVAYEWFKLASAGKLPFV